MVKGSVDFLGLNYYTADYAEEVTSFSNTNLSYTTDSRVNRTSKPYITAQTIYWTILFLLKKKKNFFGLIFIYNFTKTVTY